MSDERESKNGGSIEWNTEYVKSSRWQVSSSGILKYLRDSGVRLLTTD